VAPKEGCGKVAETVPAPGIMWWNWNDKSCDMVSWDIWFHELHDCMH